MADETKKYLISVFEQMKSQTATMAGLVCDCAALRLMMLENSPEAQERYGELFTKQMAEMTPVVSAATKLYDDLIASLKADSRLLN